MNTDHESAGQVALPIGHQGVEMDVFELIASGKYENTVPYSINNVPLDEENMTGRQVREAKEERARIAKEQKQKYREEEARLHEVFRADLEKYFGTKDNPKAGKLFEICWSRGHSGGYAEVANHYAELVELIQ
jgi:hypothetical protein